MEFLEIKKHNILTEFYTKNGLEVSKNIECDDGAIYSLVNNSEKTLAAATLSFRKGEFILDYIAVDTTCRNMGVGFLLLEKIINKAKSLGAKNVFLSAKEPLFFKKFGFLEGAPHFDINADCIDCKKLHKECNPKPMVFKID